MEHASLCIAWSMVVLLLATAALAQLGGGGGPPRGPRPPGPPVGESGGAPQPPPGMLGPNETYTNVCIEEPGDYNFWLTFVAEPHIMTEYEAAAKAAVRAINRRGGVRGGKRLGVRCTNHRAHEPAVVGELSALQTNSSILAIVGMDERYIELAMETSIPSGIVRLPLVGPQVLDAPRYGTTFHAGIIQTNPSPDVLSLGMIWAATSILARQRVALVYSADSGEVFANQIREMSRKINLDLISEFVIEEGTTQGPEDLWNSLRGASAVIWIVLKNTHTLMFLQDRFRFGLHTSLDVIMIGQLAKDSRGEVSRASGEEALINIHQITSGPSAFLSSTPIVKRFKEDVDAFANDFNSSVYGREGLLLARGPHGIRSPDALLSYINVRAFAALLDRAVEPTRQGLLDAAFLPSYIEIDGLALGPYSRSDLPNVPQCNHGMNFVSLESYLDASVGVFVAANITFERSGACDVDTAALPHPLQLAIQRTDATDGSHIRQGVERVTAFSSLLERFQVKLEEKIVGAQTNGSAGTNNTDSSVVAAPQVYAAFINPVMDAQEVISRKQAGETIAPTGGTALYLGMIPTMAVPKGSRFEALDIELLTTLEQQIFAFATYLAQLPTPPGTIVLLRPSFLHSIDYHVQESLHTLNLPPISVVSELSAAPSLDIDAGPSAAFVFGFNGTSEVLALSNLMSSRPRMSVLLAMSELSLHWELIRRDVASQYGERLYFVSALPNWMARGDSGLSRQSILADYARGFPVTDVAGDNPLAFQAYVAVTALAKVVNSFPGQPYIVSSEVAADAIYTNSVILLDSNVSLGPFRNQNCTVNSAAEAEDCRCNVGANKVHVFRLSAVLARQLDPVETHRFASCAVPYARRVEGNNLATWIIAVIVVAGFVLLVLLGALLAQLIFGNRSQQYAVKDSSKPFAVLFTDIESSTSLWALAPEAMVEALEVHHELIRKQIGKYRSFEVKTIGDAFMIVNESASDAFDMCEAIQKALMEYPWSPDIDEAYRKIAFKKHHAADGALPAKEGEVHTFVDPLHSDRTAWNGVRVRIGMHYGIGEVQLDPVTKSHDYYGTVVNAAARVESLARGGQVLCSIDALDALTDEQRSRCTSVGMQTLRGIPHKVEIFNALMLRTRIFPDEDEETFVSNTPMAASSESGTDTFHSVTDLEIHEEDGTSPAVPSLPLISAHLQRKDEPAEIAFAQKLLDAQFSRYRAADRSRIISELSRVWGVERMLSGASDAVLLRLIAARVARVVISGEEFGQAAPSRNWISNALSESNPGASIAKSNSSADIVRASNPLSSVPAGKKENGDGREHNDAFVPMGPVENTGEA